jgi:hypothetical protein
MISNLVFDTLLIHCISITSFCISGISTDSECISSLAILQLAANGRRDQARKIPYHDQSLRGESIGLVMLAG